MANSALSPRLLKLMEHEKAIEHGATAMLDMAWAFEQIKDGKHYRARYSTWDEYCEKRWGLTPQHVNRIIESSRIVRAIAKSEPRGSLLPTSEKQTRPLTALPNVDEQTAAWNDAVDAAGGDQPTAAQVQDAVNKRKPPQPSHPATFSNAILDTAAAHLRETDTKGVVLDPFAGEGGVHELRDRVENIETVGIELEPEWATKHEDTRQGNALELTASIPPASVDAIVTSPTYGNRMADHHNASDDSVRNTYKHTLGRDLSDDNSGQLQWGDDYRAFHEKAWREAVEVLKPGGTLTLNIKNHIRGGEVQRVAEWHVDCLYSLGMHMVALDIVPTKGLPSGSNADVRTLAEFVMTFRKAA